MGASVVPPLLVSDLELVTDPDLSRARTLPAEAYTSDEVFTWEREYLFEAAWVCVGRSSDVGQPQDQRAVEIGAQSVVLVRDADGVLRGFFNSCRHRGHELLAVGACTNRASIVCPYHSWAFRLDGRLRVAARFTDTEGFDPAQWPLIPVQVRERFGWIFVAVREPALDVDDWVGDLGEVIAPWIVDQMVVCASQSYELATNWKVVIENFSECYHCPAIHPELCRVTPPDSGVAFVQRRGLWTGAYLELRAGAETMSLDGRSGGQLIPGLTAEQVRRVHGLNLTPNLLVSLHPDYVLSHRVVPVSADRTLVECQWLFPAEVAGQGEFDPSYAVDFWDITNRQDFAACESVYRGMRSLGYRPGVFDERERFVRGFQAQVAQSYLEGTWAPVRADLLGTLPVDATSESMSESTSESTSESVALEPVGGQ